MDEQVVQSVGIKEFREQLTALLLSNEPIAITKHGLTMGYYIPIHQPVSGGDKRTLQAATQRLHELLEAKGLEPEVLMQEAKTLRKQAKKQVKQAPHA